MKFRIDDLFEAAFGPGVEQQREGRLEIARNALEAARHRDIDRHFDLYLDEVIFLLNRLERHEEVLEFMPDISDIRLNLRQKSLMAQSMMALGQIEEAIEFLEHWITKDPDRQDLQVRLAEAYIAAGRLKEANKTRQRIKVMYLSSVAEQSKEFGDVIHKDPTNPENHSDLSVLRADLGDFEGATRAIEAAIVLDPEDQDYREMLEEYKGKMGGGRN